ncbi:Pimeloyl-ACP methyl ester carboxylesterase [Variovorax sp. YR266]|uniref:alpha/beta fold hydrolase n=1 Tax=Variovorax sp. YR266 TaxID=1884386 RepID=UPI00089C5E05|nr:alpha/beta hydrolase [Variovorax sp. YR266]SDZ70812.1 Pimeloyl-ACP methyl ester carboxylesterase [Variovorax sp. YR266]
MTEAFDNLPLRCARVASGLEFHYVQAGEGLPLVFVHGGAGDYTTWSPQWTAFSGRYRTVSYSRRFSQPNKNPEPAVDHHSAEAEASDLRDLIDDCWHARPAILVGASYGAYTALALATSTPDRVRALVLIEPPLLPLAGETTDGMKLRDAFETKIQAPARLAFAAGDDAKAMKTLAGGIAGSPASDSFIDARMQGRMRNVRAMRVLTSSKRQFPPIDPRALASIAVPTLLISGERTEPLWREIFMTLQRHMPHAESVVMPNAGHAVARDQPEEFNSCALDFLARHGLL